MQWKLSEYSGLKSAVGRTRLSRQRQMTRTGAKPASFWICPETMHAEGISKWK